MEVGETIELPYGLTSRFYRAVERVEGVNQQETIIKLKPLAQLPPIGKDGAAIEIYTVPEAFIQYLRGRVEIMIPKKEPPILLGVDLPHRGKVNDNLGRGRST